MRILLAIVILAIGAEPIWADELKRKCNSTRKGFSACMTIINDPNSTNHKKAYAYFMMGSYKSKALNDIPGAILFFTEAINLKPTHAFQTLFYSQRGLHFIKQKKYSEALKDFDKAIKLTPSSIWAYRGRAQTFLQLNSPERAIDSLNTMLKLAEKDKRSSKNMRLSSMSMALRDRGRVYEEIGNFEQAMKDYKAAHKLYPKHKANKKAIDKLTAKLNGKKSN